MKKRLFSVVLALLMCVTVLPMSVFADSGEILYSDEDIEELFYEFEYLSDMIEPMFGNKEGIAYWKYARDMEAKKAMSALIDASCAILGETADKEYYTEVLVNMIALMEHDMSQQIEKQGQLDNLKTGADYAYSVFDIGLTVAGLDDEAKKVTDTLKAVVGGGELIFNSRAHLKYYENIVRNYTTAENFLSAVNEYSDNELLSEAASELLSANELLFKERLEVASSISGDTVTYLAKNFLDDFGFGLLKGLKEYKNDQAIKNYVDFGEKAYNVLDGLISTGEAVFKTMLLGGDVLFGTTNTFKRHVEMETMADIAEALVAAYEDVAVTTSMPSSTLYGNIRKKCDIYKMLLTTHARGEYLIYSLKTKDGGLLSVLSNWVDEYLKDEDSTVKKWYDNQTDYFEDYYGQIDALFAILSKQKFVVHKGFELHDGFIVEIEQKTEVPEGYVGIYSYADFAKIAESCPEDTTFTSLRIHDNEVNTANYILMNDITFPAEYQSAGAFYGTLDGNGYTMYGVSKPLFLYATAMVHNLGIEVNYTTADYKKESSYGAIARYQMGWAKGDLIIDNCFVKGSISVHADSGKFGALVGDGDDVVITNCYSEADIDVKTRQSSYVGGICGNNASVQNCFNTGDISLYTTGENTLQVSSMDVHAGGILGYNATFNVVNCYNTGDVDIDVPMGFHVYAGGIVGFSYGLRSNTRIISCYNTGDISVDWQAAYDTSEDYLYALDPKFGAGGILGGAGENHYIEKCYNTGSVSGELFTGGIVGMLGDSYYGSEISDCFNLGAVSGVMYVGGFLGFGGKGIKISRSYSYCTVSGGMHMGVIAAELKDAEESLTDCYYQSGYAATPLGVMYSGAQPLTEEQMADRASYEGFDFRGVWRFREGDTLPTLKQ